MKKSSVDQSLNSTNNIEFIAILKESFGYIKDDVGRGDNTFYSQDGHENAQMTGFRGLLKQINVDLYDYFCVKMDHKPHEIPRILIINAEFHKESKNSYLRGGQHTDSAEDDNYDDSILTDWCHELFSALILGTNSLSNTSVNDIGSKLKFKDGFRKNGIVLFIGRLPQLTLRDIALPAPNMPSDQEFDSAIEAMRRSILYLRMCESAGISEYAQFNINKFDIPENRSNLRSIIFDLINNKKGVDFKDKTPLIITQIKKIFTLTEEGGHSSRKSIDNQDLTVLKPSEWCVNIANFIDFDVDIDDYGRIKLLKTTQSNNNGNKIDLFANLYLFLRQLSAMQMLGIAEQPDVIKEINRVVPWMNGSGGLYVPRRRIAIIASGDKPDIDNHQPAQDLRLIRRIEVFRDLSRCLIRNNFIWSVDRKSNSLVNRSRR